MKPSNIHLGYHGTVRLLDFGIAKTLRANCNATAHQFVYWANPGAFHWVAGRTYALTILVRTDPGRLVATRTVIVGFASG